LLYFDANYTKKVLSLLSAYSSLSARKINFYAKIIDGDAKFEIQNKNTFSNSTLTTGQTVDLNSQTKPTVNLDLEEKNPNKEETSEILTEVTTKDKPSVMLISFSDYIQYKKVNLSLNKTNYQIPTDNVFYGYVSLNEMAEDLFLNILCVNATNIKFYGKYKTIDEDKDLILDNENVTYENEDIFGSFDTLNQKVSIISKNIYNNYSFMLILL